MTEFGRMLREALIEDEPFRPEAGAVALEAAAEEFRSRMRTVRLVGIVMITAPALFLAGGALLYLTAADGSDRILGALLGLFGLSAIGIGKLWLHAMVSHVQVMRELKATQLLVVRLQEGLRPGNPTND